MHMLEIDLEVKEGSWNDKINPDRGFIQGEIVRVGVLPKGTKSGAPVFVLLGELEDGTTVYLRTTWRNMALAAVALIARWGTP